jgi:NADH:ubiquinone oxidoreductase subunit K
MNQSQVYLLLSAALVGIGLGSALSRSNIISIVMSIVTAGLGALVAMATLDRHSRGHNDGMLFALCWGAVLLALMVLGCALAYRRYMSSGTTNIGDGNQLRH